MGGEDGIHNSIQKHIQEFVADLNRREKLGDLNTDRTIILKCILQKLSV